MLFFLLCTAPSVTDISQQVQNTIGRNQSQTFKYKYHSEGFTIKIEVIIGGLVVYGSFLIPTPSSVTADFKFYATNKLDYFVRPSLYNSVYGDGQGHLSENATLYISLVGQENNNTFILNTTFGDTTDSGGEYNCSKIVAALKQLVLISSQILNNYFLHMQAGL